MTKFDLGVIIKMPTVKRGSESAIYGWRLLPFKKGAEFLFSPFKSMRGGDMMYITLAELLLLLTLLIAFADLLLKFFNDSDKK